MVVRWTIPNIYGHKLGITPGAQSDLQDKSDFMNKIEANDLMLVSRHILLEIKVIVE